VRSLSLTRQALAQIRKTQALAAFILLEKKMGMRGKRTEKTNKKGIECGGVC